MYRWTHSDPRGTAQAATEALARAKAGAWDTDAFDGSTGTRAADLRQLVLLTALVANRFPIAHEELVAEGTMLRLVDPAVEQYTSDERRQAAMSVWSTWIVVSHGRSPTYEGIETVGDGAPKANAGAWPVIAIVAAVAGIAAYAVAAVYVVQNAAQVVDRYLSRQADYKKLMATQAAALEVFNEHVAKEQAAAKELPLTDAEKAMLAQLGQLQKDIAAKPDAPMPGGSGWSWPSVPWYAWAAAAAFAAWQLGFFKQAAQ